MITDVPCPRRLLLAVPLLAGMAVPAAATVIHVPADQPTIQDGIDAASFYGDEVVVADGTWSGGGNRGLVLDKHITVRSASGDPALCIIDCGGAARGFTVSGVVSAARIEGFTITNGLAGAGGGISFDNASATVVNCRIVGNSANSVAGGGLSMENGSSPTLTGCMIAGNHSSGFWGGGGLWNTGGAPHFTNCTFSGNTTSGVGNLGGAIRNMSGGDVVLTNCTLSANNAYAATAMYSEGNGTTVTLVNCVVWGHPPGVSGGVIQSDAGAVTTATYSDVQDGYAGTGNLNVNPGLVDADGADNVTGTADDDLRLGHFSPCTDAGNNAAPDLVSVTLDLAGDPRFVDDGHVADTGSGSAPLVDMGAFERQEDSVAQMVQVPGDAATIQAGIDLAQVGDEVVVADGTWTGAGNKELVIDKDVVVRSASGDPAACIIDCQGSGRAVNFSGASAAARVQGFTLTNGLQGEGGAVRFAGSSGTVLGCRLTANVANGFGGGAVEATSGSTPRLVSTTLIGNSTSGVGVVGGALRAEGGSQVVLENCAVYNNTAYDASAIYADGSGTVVTVVNAIVWGNAAGTSGIRIQAQGASTVTVTYSDVEGGYAGTGNLNANPIFADAELRLAPISPCIDVGSNAAVTQDVDYDGNQRIFDGDGNMSAVVDMGPFEYGSSSAVGIGDDPAAGPGTLLRVWPNPFRARSTVSFRLSAAGRARVAVLDVSGRRLAVLLDAPLDAGEHRVAWTGRDAAGREAPAGVYFVRVATPDGAATARVLRLP